MRVLHSFLLIGAVSACVFTSVLSAQPGRGPGAMPALRTSPATALLRARAPLGLTDEQVARLERLATAQSTALAGTPGDALRARADLADAMRGEGDAAALKRAMDRMHQLRTERALAQLKARQEARAILTADQRAKADALRAEMRRNRGAMRRGGGAGRRGWAARGGMSRPPARGPRAGGAQVPPPADPSQP